MEYSKPLWTSYKMALDPSYRLDQHRTHAYAGRCATEVLVQDQPRSLQAYSTQTPMPSRCAAFQKSP